MQLQGKRALVTGAAGGIGAAMARALSAAGCQLWLVDVAAGVQEVAAELNACCSQISVADADAVAQLAAEVEAAWGALHLLVNNAGVTVLGTFEEHSAADWARVMGVNLGGVVNGCRSFLPLLRREGGRIVNISSVFGIVGVPGQTAYCASKFAVRGFTEALAEELAGSNVGVTVVHPGGVRTGIIRNASVAALRTGDTSVHGALSSFFERRTVPPARVAARIVAAVQADTARVLVCPETYVFDWLRRLAPGLGNRLAVRILTRAMGINPLG